MDPEILTELGNNITNSFRTMMSDIAPLWSDLGIAGDDQVRRCKAAQDHLLAEMKNIVESEDHAIKQFLANINEKMDEIDELNTVLALEPTAMDDSMGLLEKDRYLNEKLVGLRQVLKKRKEDLKQLKKTERKFCTIFCIPPHRVSSQSGVPSEADLRELEEYVDMLMEKRDRLHRQFCSDKRELIEIMQTAGLTPETDFERQALCCEEDEFLLSDGNLQELDAFLAKARGRMSELEKEKEALVEKAIKLWDRLSVSADEKQSFLASWKDCSQSTLETIQLEIERCEIIKRKDIKRYVGVLHDELRVLWVKCHVSESEQRQFLDQVDQDSECSIDRYEAEIQRVDEYHKNAKDVLEKIEKWRELWDLLIDFENKAKDHQKYTNRGGNLLREERERKKLNRDFPKLENELYKAINKYERSSGEKFLFNGMSFETFAANERLQQEENKRILKEQTNVTLLEPATSNKRFSTTLLKSTSSKVSTPNTRMSVPLTPDVYSHMKDHYDAISSRSSGTRVIGPDDINCPSSFIKNSGTCKNSNSLKRQIKNCDSSSPKSLLKPSNDILSASLKIQVKVYDTTNSSKEPKSRMKVSGATNVPSSSKGRIKDSDTLNVPMAFRTTTPARASSSLRKGLRSSPNAASSSSSSSEPRKYPRSSTPKKVIARKTYSIRLNKPLDKEKKNLPNED